MKTYHVTLDGREFIVEVSDGAVTLNGETLAAEVVPLGPLGSFGLGVGSSGRMFNAERGSDGHWTIDVDGRSRRLRVIDDRRHAIEQMTIAAKGAQGPSPVRANMPGLVVSVGAEVGDRVKAGQGMVIVEAMKMENELRAQADGIVHRIHVKAGDTVEKDQVLIEFEMAEDAS